MATARFQINAGVGVRGAVKRAIKDYCFQQGIRCDVEEDKRFLDSSYYFYLRGTSEQILQAEADIGAWSQKVMGKPFDS